MKLDPLSMLGSSHNRSTHRRSLRGKARTASLDSFDMLPDDDIGEGDEINLLEGSESSEEEPPAPSMLKQPSGKNLMSEMMRESTSIFAAEFEGEMNEVDLDRKFRKSSHKKHMSADDVMGFLPPGDDSKRRSFGGHRRTRKNSEDELSVRSEHGTRSISLFSHHKKKRGGRKSTKTDKSGDELSTRSEHGTRSIPILSPKKRGGRISLDDKSDDDQSTTSEHTRSRSISLFSSSKRGGRRSSVTIGDPTLSSEKEVPTERSMSLGYGPKSGAFSLPIDAMDDDSSDVYSDFIKSDDEETMPSLLTKKDKQKKKKKSGDKSKSDSESDPLGTVSSHFRRRKDKKHRSSHKSRSKKEKDIQSPPADKDDNENSSPKHKKKDKVKSSKSKSKHKKSKSDLDSVVKDVEGVQKVSKGDADGGAFNKSFVQLDFCSTTED